MAVRPTTNQWDWIYATRALDAVGWYEPDPFTSRKLVDEAVTRGARSIIDVGGGASSLVDHLIDLDLDRVAVLDISAAGLALAQHRLGTRASEVEWIVGDFSKLRDVGHFDVWHDRAAFHFLLDDGSRRGYVRLAERTVPVGGTAIIATFAEDGPERCSGMPVRRYDPLSLALECGGGFRLTSALRYEHHTPAGVPQRFQYSCLERVIPGAES
jgi:SAM-dependent methyltransferase